MEAPEKIYIHPNIGGREFLVPWLQRAANNESVEYLRTDYAEKVFLRKANAWLAEIHRVCDITDENGYRVGLEKLQANFKKYMED